MKSSKKPRSSLPDLSNGSDGKFPAPKVAKERSEDALARIVRGLEELRIITTPELATAALKTDIPTTVSAFLKKHKLGNSTLYCTHKDYVEEVQEETERVKELIRLSRDKSRRSSNRAKRGELAAKIDELAELRARHDALLMDTLKMSSEIEAVRLDKSHFQRMAYDLLDRLNEALASTGKTPIDATSILPKRDSSRLTLVSSSNKITPIFRM